MGWLWFGLHARVTYTQREDWKERNLNRKSGYLGVRGQQVEFYFLI